MHKTNKRQRYKRRAKGSVQAQGLVRSLSLSLFGVAFEVCLKDGDDGGVLVLGGPEQGSVALV